MSRAIDGLLGRIADANLRAELAREVEVLRANKDFGLVFERHLPENVRLYGQTIRRGSSVQELTNVTGEVWVVRRIDGEVATLIDDEGAEVEKPLSELVVVSEFGEPIYPGFEVVDSLERGGDKPFHTVINGENFHVLEALAYVYEGQVDCIYIDPPYNTGASDWTYNNDYVDGEDAYRHSKWLSFMEKRLVLAQTLLKSDGVLIITIDEHELQTLGLLLRQTLKLAREVQLVTIVNNTAGSMSPGKFSRADEYAYFCFFGNSKPSPMGTDLLSSARPTAQYWFPLHRSRGLNDRPSKRPNLVYPVVVDPEALRIVGSGRSLQERVAAGEVSGDLDDWLPEGDEKVDGFPVVWPILDSGEMTTWQLSSAKLMSLCEEGFVRVRKPVKSDGPRPFTLAYVKSGNQAKVRSGVVPVKGREPGGALILESVERNTIPKTVWKVPAHDARLYGTTMLRSLLGATAFTYPKSPYAVADTLETVVADKPDALVLDFFAGSGTTFQALGMLNRKDGGNRRCILVTNNEVPESERGTLVAKGFSPGDDEYERRGIARAVTWPRVRACISGTLANGEPIAGAYLDGTPLVDGLEESATFLRLKYLEKNNIARDKAFEAIAPLLWLKAGAKGPQIAKVKKPSAAPKGASYAVLFDTAHAAEFIEALRDSEDIEHAYIVTNSMAEYQQIIAELPTTIETAMLYEDYILSFELNLGRLL